MLLWVPGPTQKPVVPDEPLVVPLVPVVPLVGKAQKPAELAKPEQHSKPLLAPTNTPRGKHMVPVVPVVPLLAVPMVLVVPVVPVLVPVDTTEQEQVPEAGSQAKKPHRVGFWLQSPSGWQAPPGPMPFVSSQKPLAQSAFWLQIAQVGNPPPVVPVEPVLLEVWTRQTHPTPEGEHDSGAHAVGSVPQSSASQ